MHVADGLADARAALERPGARWAVVLDDAENLHGWLSAERAAGVGHGRIGGAGGWRPGCRCDASLKTAFSTMLQHEAGWVAVLDGDRFLGVLTPESLHAALRRSVEGVAPEVAGRQRTPEGHAILARLGGDAPVGSLRPRAGRGRRDSSQSAAATRAAEQTTPITAVTVSPPAACSRPTAGATCTQHPGPDPQRRPRPRRRWPAPGPRAGRPASAPPAAPGRRAASWPPAARRRGRRAGRASRVRSVRAPSASATASTPSGAGSHQSSGGSSP